MCTSLYILADIGVATEGDKFDAGVTGREVHLFQENGDTELAIVGLSGALLGPELRRELFSPSGWLPFFLKLKPRKRLPDSEPPLEEP